MDGRPLEYLLSESIALFRTIKIFNLNTQFIKSAEFSILIIIYHKTNKISAVDISKYLHCSKVYVSNKINILIEKNYVKKEKNTSDARQYYLDLTPSGEQLVREYKDKYMNVTNYLYEKLGEEKSKEFISLLVESRNILREYENKNHK